MQKIEDPSNPKKPIELSDSFKSLNFLEGFDELKGGFLGKYSPSIVASLVMVFQKILLKMSHDTATMDQSNQSSTRFNFADFHSLVDEWMKIDLSEVEEGDENLEILREVREQLIGAIDCFL